MGVLISEVIDLDLSTLNFKTATEDVQILILLTCMWIGILMAFSHSVVDCTKMMKLHSNLAKAHSCWSSNSNWLVRPSLVKHSWYGSKLRNMTCALCKANIGPRVDVLGNGHWWCMLNVLHYLRKTLCCAPCQVATKVWRRTHDESRWLISKYIPNIFTLWTYIVGLWFLSSSFL